MLKQNLIKNWLIIGIFALIFFAGLFPSLGAKGGPLKPEYTVKYGAVSLIFLISGLSLRTESVLETFRQYKLHVFVQCFTFLFIPVYVTFLVSFIQFFFSLDIWTLKGLLTVACMPPPVSSAVILTKSALGNETAAIFNSVLGSFLGILITPILLLITLKVSSSVPFANTVFQLLSTVLLPLFIGQIIKKSTNLNPQKLSLSNISQSALLFIIYCTFCDAFQMSGSGIETFDVLLAVFLVLLVKISLISINFFVAKKLDCFSETDIIAILFCSTHKSLTLGIPILRIMFGDVPYFTKLTLPLLIYHPVQIILGGFLVSPLKDWVNSKRRKLKPSV